MAASPTRPVDCLGGGRHLPRDKLLIFGDQQHAAEARFFGSDRQVFEIASPKHTPRVTTQGHFVGYPGDSSAASVAWSQMACHFPARNATCRGDHVDLEPA